jgi:energy-coupling factor transporter ATP-binding protein EcfA2
MATKKKNPFSKANVGELVQLAEMIEEKSKFLFKKFEKEFRSFIKEYNGESIAVVGPKAAGKSTFIKIFQNSKISNEKLKSYVATEKDEIKSFKCRWPVTISDSKTINFRFRYKKSSDLGGEKYIRDEHWMSVLEKSRIIFFLVDGEKVLKNKDVIYRESALEDLQWIGERVNQLPPGFNVVPIFNKIDTMCSLGETYDSFQEVHNVELNSFIAEARKRWPKSFRNKLCDVTVCSLLNLTMRQDAFVSIIHKIMGEELLAAYTRQTE